MSASPRALLATHTPAASTAATKTLAAETGVQWLIHGISGSLDSTPTAPVLLTTTGLDGDQVAIYITAAGPFNHQFPMPLSGAYGGAVVVTLGDPGDTHTATLCVHYSKA